MHKKYLFVLTILVVVLVSTGFLVSHEDAESIKKGTGDVRYVGVQGNATIPVFRLLLMMPVKMILFVFIRVYIMNILPYQSQCAFMASQCEIPS